MSSAGSGKSSNLARWLEATNLAADFMRQSTSTEDFVFQVFKKQVAKLGLRGGIAILNLEDQRLHFKSIAQPGRTGALQSFEKLFNIDAVDYAIEVDQVDVYRRAFQDGEPVFIENTSKVLSQMLPFSEDSLMSRLVDNFGHDPAAYLPLYNQEKIIGVLNIAGPELTKDDLPALTVFAGTISAALSNVSLFNDLKMQESSYRSLFKNLPVGIFRVDKDGRFIMANPAFLAQFRVADFEQIRGKTLQNAGIQPVHKRDKIIEKLVQEGEIIGYESEWITEQGERIFFKENIKVSYDAQGEVAYYEGSVEDITERKQTDHLLKKQLDDMMLLNQIAATGAGSDSLDGLVASVTDFIGERLFPDHFGVILWDEGQGILKMHPSYRGVPEELMDHQFHPNVGIIGKVFSTGKALMVSETSRDPDYIPPGMEMGSELCVPIKAGEKVIGVLNAERKGANAFHIEDKILLQTMADQIATALEKVTSFESVEKQAMQLALLNEAVLTTSRILDPNELINLIATQINELLAPDFFMLTLYDQDRQELEVAVSTSKGEINQDTSSIVLPLEQGGLTSLVIETGQVLQVDDLENSPLIVGIEQMQTRMVGSWVGVPLIYGKLVIGALNVQYYDKMVVTEDQTQFLVSLASHAAIAITNGRLYDDISTRFRLSKQLAGISESLNRSLSYSQVIQEVGQGSCVLMNNSGGMILEQDETGKYTCVWNSNLSEDFIRKVSETVISDFGSQSEPWICNDVTKLKPDHPLKQVSLENAVGSISLWPLIYEGEINAVIGCVKPGSYHWGDVERQAMVTFTRQAALSLQNARLLEAERSRRMEAEALYKTTAALTSNLDLGRVLNNVLVELYRVVEFSSAGIHLLDTDILRTVAAQGLMIDTTQFLGNETRLSKRFLERLTEKSGPILIEDIRLVEGFSIPDEISYTRGWIGIPLIINQKVIGLLSMESDEIAGFELSDARKASGFANQAAIAIETSRLFGQTQRRLQVLQAIHTIDQAISRSLDLSLTFDVLLEQALSLLNVDLVRIFSFEPEARIFDLVAEKTYLSTNPISKTSLFRSADAWEAVNTRQIVHTEIENSDGNISRTIFRGYTCAPLITRGLIRGVIEIFDTERPIPTEEWIDLLNTFSTQAAIAIENDDLLTSLKRSNEELITAYDRTLEGWAYALELRDRETIGHSRRVTELTMRLAKQMGISGTDLANIRRGTLLHDIGKMGLPDSILLKNGPLTREEELQMQQHPHLAYEMLKSIPYLRAALDVPYYHHEKWDGSGYPHGLKGENIPLAARIFSVVDVWDAVVFDRPYREAWTKKDAYEYIKEQSGTHFDPRIVEVFLEIIKEDLTETGDLPETE
ncbi:MAG: GAF domain-containing protein [Anaerolineales bacterium]